MDTTEQSPQLPYSAREFSYVRKVFYGLDPSKVYILALHIPKSERKNKDEVTRIVNQTSLYLKTSGLKNVIVVPYSVSVYEQGNSIARIKNLFN